jgi:hypothetical protein
MPFGEVARFEELSEQGFVGALHVGFFGLDGLGFSSKPDDVGGEL